MDPSITEVIPYLTHPLALVGYVPGARDPHALQALSLAYVAVPCVLKLMAAGLLWRCWIMTKEDE